MKKHLLPLLIALCWLPAQAQVWTWAQAVPNATAYATASDAAGNVYVAGSFSSSATFGTITLYSVGYGDGFVAKMDPSGAYLWAIKIGWTSNDGIGRLKLGGNGDIYIAGVLGSAVVVGTTYLTTPLFVARLSPNGTFRWANGVNASTLWGLAVDAQGEAFVAGNGTGTFDAYQTSGKIYVAKLSANGNWQWASEATSMGEIYCWTIAVDGAGNARIGGNFTFELRFGGFVVQADPARGYGIYVASISPTGNWQWATIAEGTNSGTCRSLCVDSVGAVYLTGNFSQAWSFGSTPLTNNSRAYDCYVAKLSPQGNWEWATQSDSVDWDLSPLSIAVNASGRSFIAGSYKGYARLGASTLTAPGIWAEEVFLASLSPSGSWLSAESLAGGRYYNVANGLCLPRQGELVVVGGFASQYMQVGPYQLASNGSAMFVAQQRTPPAGVAEVGTGAGFQLAPNPAPGVVYLTALPPGGAPVEVVDGLGRVVGRYRRVGESMRLDLRQLPAGLYLVRTGQQTRRLVLE